MQFDETKRPKIGIAVFTFREGTFLATKRIGSHGANTWSIPGGHLEFGESWEQCARRETMEETGMEITNVNFLAATNDIFDTENKHYVTIWMTADWQANEPENKEPEKMLDMQWVDFGNLPQPLFEPCWQNLRALRPDLFAQS
jgi:8-oxo-dGTP diphosphatase